MDRLYIETKIAADDAGTISGIAWRFDQGDRVNDWIDKSAFEKTTMPIPLLFGHDLNDPLGTVDTAVEKGNALHITGKLLVNDVPRARQVHALVKSGAVRGISIGFIAKKSGSRPGGGRLIKSLEWLEASLVTIGMHPGAKVTTAKTAIEALRIAEAINRARAALITGSNR